MLGYVLILLATICFGAQNLITRVLFTPSNLFGVLETGGFVEPTLPNSFLLMFMRMAVGVPLMAVLLPPVYPPMWSDLRRLGSADYRRELYLALVGGVLMFSYLALLYVSVGRIAAGIALTLFFTFPVYTAVLDWYWFGHRPSTGRWAILALILLGSALTIPMTGAAIASWVGIVFGLASGVVYAFYTVVAQKAFETFHPVPFTGMSFAVTLVLSAASLLLWPGDLVGLLWPALWVGGLLSAIATLTGHVLNNLGIRSVGATAASMLGAANPALTAVLAWGMLQEQLSVVQGLGVLLVTVSVGLLSLTKPS
ncbi:DMT family transporter [Phormidium tenue]|uniref:Transporter n=1 Tax=Phormidium tenue NIES-30 TaxID=549789 RepID=A0A1U7J0W5_9CYAN|nr:DMT family transporter [Phormidium tenue]MBD2233974.1 EamA family transporter [Phormidium tenue FACHB-1052]OKH45417.1 transporter [Phormidium tenue NIES-30]